MILRRSIVSLAATLLLAASPASAAPGFLQHPGVAENVIWSFGGPGDAFDPGFGVTFDADNNMYGTTLGGGTQNGGVAYELSPSNGGYTETILYDFAYRVQPASGLTLDASGDLFGVTLGGGRFSGGTAYEIFPTQVGYGESTIWNFGGGRDGSSPRGNLLLDASGALLGSAFDGGKHGEGKVFALAPKRRGYGEKTFLNGGVKESKPNGRLVGDGSGSLYGVGSAGGGTVYKLTPSVHGYTLKILHAFGGSGDGQYPVAPLLVGASGAIYGTTSNGGAFSGGTAFMLTPYGRGYSETVLWSFGNGSDGKFPNGGLVTDASGALYGTTGEGGDVANLGTVFALTPAPSGYTESVIWNFFSSEGDGSEPDSGLVADGSGAFYGTTSNGGNYMVGTVYRIVP